LNLIIGFFLWDFFAESTRNGVASLASKSYLLTKARLPAWVLVATSRVNAGVNLIFFAVVITLYLSFTRHSLGVVNVGLFVLYLLCFVAIVLGLSFATSVL